MASEIRVNKINSTSGVGTMTLSPTGLDIAGITTISNTTNSTSSTTGALIVTGGVGIGASLNVGGSVSIGGTITYEDVTNVDSTGIVTAGRGLRVTAGGIKVTAGVSTFNARVDALGSIGIQDTGRLYYGSSNIAAIDGSHGGSGYLKFFTAGNEIGRLDAGGRLIIGQTTNYTAYADSKLQVGATDSKAAIQVTRWSNDGSSPYITLGKSRGGFGSYTVVQSGDRLGQINFVGTDGTDMASPAAGIAGYVDGTPGSNDMPGRLVFFTSSDGAAAETERMRLDSTGRFGIGKTPESAGSGNGSLSKLQVKGLDTPNDYDGILIGHGYNRATIAIGANYDLVITSNAYPANATSNGIRFKCGTSGGGGPSEHMRITAAGTVNIGNGFLTQTSRLFSVIENHASGGEIAYFGNDDGSANYGGLVISAGETDRECRLESAYGASFMTFWTQTSGGSADERLRINPDGDVWFNKTNATDLYGWTSGGGITWKANKNTQQFATQRGDGWASIYINKTRTHEGSDDRFISFLWSASTVGTITSNGSNTSYNTSSDYRLKDQITDISDGIARVRQLKPKRFAWITDPDRKVQDGFLAHEAQSIVPESVTGTKDQVVTESEWNDGSQPEDKKIGDAIYQTMDHSKLVPLLTAALQEAITEIDNLKTRVSTLESS